jgi:hypothetical protein
VQEIDREQLPKHHLSSIRSLKEKFKDIIQAYDMKHNTLMTYSIDCTDSLKCFVHKVGHIARQLSLGSSFHCRLSLLHKIVHRHDSFVKSVTNADERPVKTDGLGLLIAMLLSDADRWAALILCLWIVSK